MLETFMTRWHGRAVRRLEARGARLRARLDHLHARKEAHLITPAQYSRKKADLDDRIRRLSARERTLRGAIKRERDRGRRSAKPAAR